MCKCFEINDIGFRFTGSRGEGESTFKDTLAKKGEMYPKLCSKPGIVARKPAALYHLGWPAILGLGA